MTATTQTQTKSSNRPKRRPKWGWVLNLVGWLLFTGLLAALIYVAWINIAPYVLLVEKLAPKNQNWLLNVPIIGNLAKTWSGLLSTIVGFLVWAVIQIFQTMWILIRLDRQALAGAVSQSYVNHQTLKDRDDDDDTTRNVKETARRIPFFFIRWAGYLGLGAYTFDAIVGVSLYPPARSIGQFLNALSLGAWQQIDIENAIKLSVMLFSFEALLVMVIISWQWVSARSWSYGEG